MFVMDVAKGPFKILPTAPIPCVRGYVGIWGGGAVLTGLCVGGRRVLVTLCFCAQGEDTYYSPSELRTQKGDRERPAD